jgi:hypothetical protein
LTEPVLKIGSVSIDHWELVHIYHCGNTVAAKRLSRALRRWFPRATVTMPPPFDQLAATPGVGETQLYVMMCVLDYTGADPLTWVEPKDGTPTVTMSTLRRRAVHHAKEEGTWPPEKKSK